MRIKDWPVIRLFWNSHERRLRALWRLVGQLLILVLIALPLQLGLGVVVWNLSVPQPLLMVLTSFEVCLALLISVWLAGRFLDRRPFADFGLHLDRDWWIDLGFGLFLGAFLMLLIFLTELVVGWVTVTGTFVVRDPGSVFLLAILPPLLIFVAVGLYEELFSRGYQLRNLAEGLNWSVIGPKAAIVIGALFSSAVFGILHLGNPHASFISTFNIFLAGAVVLAMGYLLTGELSIPIGVHITWNFFQGNVFGFPVSGGDFSSATFISIQQGGPDLWTGGAFGPEAGLIGVGAMLLGGLLIALWVGWRYGQIRLHTALAEAPQQSGEG